MTTRQPPGNNDLPQLAVADPGHVIRGIQYLPCHRRNIVLNLGEMSFNQHYTVE